MKQVLLLLNYPIVHNNTHASSMDNCHHSILGPLYKDSLCLKGKGQCWVG